MTEIKLLDISKVYASGAEATVAVIAAAQYLSRVWFQ